MPGLPKTIGDLRAIVSNAPPPSAEDRLQLALIQVEMARDSLAAAQPAIAKAFIADAELHLREAKARLAEPPLATVGRLGGVP